MRLAGHAQTGVLRVIIAVVSRSDDWVDRAKTTLGALRRSLEAEGGSLVVSQGPPEIVGAVSAWGALGPAALITSGIQAALDPAGILNRGTSPQ